MTKLVCKINIICLVACCDGCFWFPGSAAKQGRHISSCSVRNPLASCVKDHRGNAESSFSIKHVHYIYRNNGFKNYV